MHKMPLSTHLLMQLMQLVVVLMQLLLMHLRNLYNEKLGRTKPRIKSRIKSQIIITNNHE